MEAAIKELLNDPKFIEVSTAIKFQLDEENKINVFSLVDEYISENILSAFLSALCDSSQKHALGDLFVNALVDTCKDLDIAAAQELASTTFTKTISLTEWVIPISKRRIDIVIELKNAANVLVGVIGIEHKITIESEEGPKQIEDYQTALHKAFPTIPKLLIFLTPMRKQSITKAEYSPCKQIDVGYADLANAINIMVSNSSVVEESKLLLSSFKNYLISLINKQIMSQDLTKQIRDIFMNPVHRATIKYIYENFPTVLQVLDKSKDILLNKGIEGVQIFKCHEIKCYLDYDERNEYEIYLMLQCGVPEPTIGTEYSCRLMIYEENKERRELLKKHVDILQLPYSSGKLNHWWNWVNIWRGTGVTLTDLGEQDVNEMVNILTSNSEKLKEHFKEISDKVSNIYANQ